MSLLGLRGIRELLESLGVHLHVAAHDAVRDGGHRLVPVRLLRTLHEVLHHQRVRGCFVHAHHLLNSIRVEQEKCTLSRLVMHRLRCLDQAFQKFGTKIGETSLDKVPVRIKELFYLIKKYNFFRWVGDWPDFEQ